MSEYRLPPSRVVKEEWEDWTDDEPVTPATPKDDIVLIALPEESPVTSTTADAAPRRVGQTGQRVSVGMARQSTQRLKRVKSRQKQKAKNAKFGISLVTDMTKFRQQQQYQQQLQQQQQQQQQYKQHVAHSMDQENSLRMSRTGKFVDAAALKALEGAVSADSPNSKAFGWLRKKTATGMAMALTPTDNKRNDLLAVETPVSADVSSPGVGPIVIGFAMPQDSNVVISPQTAVVETPVNYSRYFGKLGKAPRTTAKQPVSAWSPDTPDADDRVGLSPLMESELLGRHRTLNTPLVSGNQRDTRATFFADSEYDYGSITPRGAPTSRDTKTTVILFNDEEDDDDLATPVTLFEEDGSPVTTRRKSTKAKGRARSGTATSSRSQGWWDQVTSPFTQSPQTARSPAPPHGNSPLTQEALEWWKTTDLKKVSHPQRDDSGAAVAALSSAKKPTEPLQAPRIVIEDVSPQPTASSSTQPLQTMEPHPRESHAEKARVLLEEDQNPTEEPPPYSPPSSKKQQNVRYRAVFPPDHPLTNMYPPSPGPVSPGLAGTMTSQGAISMTDVSLTPPTAARLPDRPQGSFVPSDHFMSVTGNGPRQKAERRRRRQEKEDALAHRVGGYWRGRGCIPQNGCFGRAGRGGRKRRRVCLGVLAGVLILIALAVTLPLVLLRRGGEEPVRESRFLNLTNFPPMPTGISTVVGPESDISTACVQPATLWSCSLPKEEAESVAPHKADQPTFVLHIQFDNRTGQPWNIPNGEPPRPTPTKGPSTENETEFGQGRNRGNLTEDTVKDAIKLPQLMRRLFLGARQEDNVPSSEAGIKPSPAPPKFADIFFLGNTTDKVASNEKAGEPTPFFITMLRSIDSDPAGPTQVVNPLGRRGRLERRQDGQGKDLERGLTNELDKIAPPPKLNPDGTGAPADLLAYPVQQPVRLYDRGLPTERYGFYTYYNKTIYVKSIQPLDSDLGEETVPADRDGGALRTESNFVVTWLSARYKVEIWTRRSNSTRLLSSSSASGSEPSADDNTQTQQPGTFPYPITVTLDTHGGIEGSKFAFARPVDERQRIVLRDARFILNRMNQTGDHANPAGLFNPSFGGMDGGTGGCKCEYTNFVELNR